MKRKNKVLPVEYFELSDLSDTARKTVLEYVKYRARRLKLADEEAQATQYGDQIKYFLYGRRVEAEHIRDFIKYVKTVNGTGKKRWSSY